MDFAHVGDRDGANGVYLINIIDPDRLRWAVAQYEHVGFSDLGAEAHAMSDLQAAKTFQAFVEPRPREPLIKSRSLSASLLREGSDIESSQEHCQRERKRGRKQREAPFGRALPGALTALRLIVWGPPHGFTAPCHHAR